MKWGHRAGFPALHSGTAQSNASLSSLSTPTNLTVATTEVSAAACYYVRGGGEEKESATDKTSCSRARAVRASGCSAYIWWQRQEHPLVSLDALVSATFLFEYVSMLLPRVPQRGSLCAGEDAFLRRRAIVERMYCHTWARMVSRDWGPSRACQCHFCE